MFLIFVSFAGFLFGCELCFALICVLVVGFCLVVCVWV